ncbi:hypothetical protein [Liquorilactobacillus mali]|nr:hypothetical protein [Liquorilactobacillus mali]
MKTNFIKEGKDVGKEQINVVKLNAVISDLFDRAEKLKEKLPSDFVQNGIYSHEKDVYSKFRKYLIESGGDFMDSSAAFKTEFEDWVKDVRDLIAWVSKHESLNNLKEEINSKNFLLLRPSYGYLNERMEYSAFNLEDAALFNEENIQHFNQDFVDTLIKIPMNPIDIAELPFDLPVYQSRN